MQRRKFVLTTGIALAGIPLLGACSSGNRNTEGDKESESDSAAAKAPESILKISLAQWSLHRALQAGEMDNLDFAGVAKNTYGIDGIEYVNRFFKDKKKNSKYLDEMNLRANDAGVKQLLIMVDDEGGLAELDDKTRMKSIQNHYNWVASAKHLGCHSIRVNAYGVGSREDMHLAAVDGLSRLAEFAKDFKINVIVENHGGLSSDGSWLSGVMKEINMDNCGTLPDFGNFCVRNEDGKCVEEYDRYKGVTELMPFAKAVSAKSNNFDSNGKETNTDFSKMIGIVKDAGYSGYVGIEYEGSVLSEHDGILATKKLLEKII